MERIEERKEKRQQQFIKRYDYEPQTHEDKKNYL